MVLFRRKKPQEDASSTIDPNASDASTTGNDVQPKVSMFVFRVPVRIPTFVADQVIFFRKVPVPPRIIL